MLNTLKFDRASAARGHRKAMNLHMKRTFLALLFAVCAAFQLTAQTVGTNEHPILNTTQLDNQPWFYNLDSALANPDMVYKLSLTDQKLKELPADFGKLRNLQILSLSNCKLKAIPLEIKECKNLQMASFYSNKIRVLPAEMRELKQLEILYLGKNKLMEIPNWFGTLTKLKRVDISRNALTPADVSNIHRMLPKADVTF